MGISPPPPLKIVLKVTALQSTVHTKMRKKIFDTRKFLKLYIKVKTLHTIRYISNSFQLMTQKSTLTREWLLVKILNPLPYYF